MTIHFYEMKSLSDFAYNWLFVVVVKSQCRHFQKAVIFIQFFFFLNGKYITSLRDCNLHVQVKCHFQILTRFCCVGWNIYENHFSSSCKEGASNIYRKLRLLQHLASAHQPDKSRSTDRTCRSQCFFEFGNGNRPITSEFFWVVNAECSCMLLMIKFKQTSLYRTSYMNQSAVQFAVLHLKRE